MKASIVLLLTLASAAVSVAEEIKQLYHIQALRSVLDAMETQYAEHMDIWKQFELKNPSLSTTDPLVDMTLYTTPSFADKLGLQLRTSSTLFSIRNEASVDVQALIETERATNNACLERTKNRIFSAADLKSDAFFDCFHDYASIVAFLSQMVASNADILSSFKISETFEQRDILGYKLAIDGNSNSSNDNNNNNNNKPAIFIEGLLHAREWLAVPTVIYTMASLIDAYRANDSEVIEILQAFNFYVVPLVNIDGYEYSRTKDRMWRKNRRKISRSGALRGSRFFETYGVDLNRNWGPAEQFCKSGASKNPRSTTYCGASAFSEPETAGIEAFIESHRDIVGGIDVHTYGDMVLRPYGFTYTAAHEPHKTKLQTLGQTVADAVNAHANGQYKNIRAAELYVACGTMMDSMFETHGVPAITFELRGGSFSVDPSLIRTAGPEIFKGIKVFADQVAHYNVVV